MSEDSSPRPKKPKPLSVQEVRFCQEYVLKGNATEAYVQAGFEHASRHAAESGAFDKLRKPEIEKYIEELRQCADDAARVTIEEIYSGVRSIARADRRKLFDSKGRLLPPDQIPDDIAAAIESVESEENYEPVPGERGKKKLKGYTRKVKTGSRIAAYRLLAELKQYLGTDKTNEGKKPDPLIIGGDADPEKL